MKNIVIRLGLLVLISFGCCIVNAQTPTYPYDTTANKRPNADRYLLSEPFKDECTPLDVFEWVSPEIQRKDYTDSEYINFKLLLDFNKGGFNYYELMVGTYITDIAQPFYTDTTITIKGVSILAPIRYFFGRYAFIGIADTNFDIKRKALITDIPIPKNINLWSNKLWLNYNEIWFDSAITVNGKFFVIWDNPKPQPYNGYNWENANIDDINNINIKDTNMIVMDYCFVHIMAAKNSYAYFNCPIESIPYTRRLRIKLPHEDNWHNNYSNFYLYWKDRFFAKDAIAVPAHPGDTYEWVPTTTNINWMSYPKYQDIKAFYIFPILEEDSISSIKNIDLDKFTYIFPNPANDMVTIQCSFKIKDIELINFMGINVDKFVINSYNKSIDITKYDKGNYLLKITTSNGTTYKKIFIQ